MAAGGRWPHNLGPLRGEQVSKVNGYFWHFTHVVGPPSVLWHEPCYVRAPVRSKEVGVRVTKIVTYEREVTKIVTSFPSVFGEVTKSVASEVTKNVTHSERMESC